MFSEFQAESIVTSLTQSWSEGMGSATVVTAGTGMGKTLGFAIPVVADALIANRSSGRVCSQLRVCEKRPGKGPVFRDKGNRQAGQQGPDFVGPERAMPGNSN